MVGDLESFVQWLRELDAAPFRGSGGDARDGPEHGLFGAKSTGGGSGGTVAVLGRPETEPLVHDIASAHAHESGREARVFTGSSTGGVNVPVQRLPLTADTGA